MNGTSPGLNESEPVVLRASTIRRLMPMVRLMGSLDSVINAMLDELSEGELVLDAWEADNGIRVVMTYKGTKTLGWYNKDGSIDVSDGDGPWSNEDRRFGSPSEAAVAVADAINGRTGSSLNGNLYWKVERTGQTLGDWLRSNGR